MSGSLLTITSPANHNLEINAIPGHFVTSHSHINYYIDITRMKHEHTMAHEAAIALAQNYAYEKVVDTIICMDGSEVIGAFLARELAKSDLVSVNRQKNINIVSPEYSNGQMIFRDNLEPMIAGKHILLLIASVTTGKTIRRALECVSYYGGIPQGIAAIFSALPELEGIKIYSLFTNLDIPGYESHSFRDCPQCRNGVRIDALANSYGFSKI